MTNDAEVLASIALPIRGTGDELHTFQTPCVAAGPTTAAVVYIGTVDSALHVFARLLPW